MDPEKIAETSAATEENQAEPRVDIGTVDVSVPDPQAEKIVPAENASGSVPDEGVTLDSLAGAHADQFAGFDPAVHATGPDGKPRMTAKGEYAKKRGRKMGTGAPTSGTAPYALPDPTVPAGGGASLTGDVPRDGNAPSRPVMNSEEAARWSANLVFNVGGFVFGEDLGKPKDKDEAQGMKTAFRNYYDTVGTPNIPPEIGLALASGMDAVPRLRHESMREKVARWLGGLKDFLGIRRSKENVAQLHTEKSAPVKQAGGTMTWAATR